MQRINDTHHWPLSVRHPPYSAARCAIVVDSTAASAAARHTAIAQIPIDSPSR
jgi:hypothetical protein